MSNNQVLNDVRIFIYIVKQGSLIAAADALAIPLPTISRRLVALETNLGKKLMFRDNRTITLTPYGEAFYMACAELVFSLDSEIDKLRELGAGMSGVMKISAPQELFYHYVHEQLAEFQDENPDVTFDIALPSKISSQKFGQSDIIITKDIHEFNELTGKPFCETRFVMCAAPDYPVGTLSHPAELADSGIKIITVKTYEKWGFVDNSELKEKVVVEPTPYIRTDEFKLARYFAMGGKGVALFPYHFVMNDISDGRLSVINIDGWVPEKTTHYLLYAHFRDIPLKTRELILFLTRGGVIKF
ncbi:LysR family transcriptional regulator [Enterobacteriaceae bacterium BIT-l23]|uniref:LysR family transcriptional regulator n=1 Tax=Jejubacter sp. L23 TaxID=3092086 RepID=UPI0015844C66|nr:LysR family transcriptional regulator [Enterobacteriaceae bacterium BIT-l23]